MTLTADQKISINAALFQLIDETNPAFIKPASILIKFLDELPSLPQLQLASLDNNSSKSNTFNAFSPGVGNVQVGSDSENQEPWKGFKEIIVGKFKVSKYRRSVCIRHLQNTSARTYFFDDPFTYHTLFFDKDKSPTLLTVDEEVVDWTLRIFSYGLVKKTANQRVVKSVDNQKIGTIYDTHPACLIIK